MKFKVIVSDPAWAAADQLKMDNTPRGTDANYKTLSIEDIKNLKVKEISEDDAVLALWVPSWLLQEGLDVMKSWGFRQTQTHIWVKVKKKPFAELAHLVVKYMRNFLKQKDKKPNKQILADISKIISDFSLSDTLSFYMGRLFRQTHEICLVGVRGKIYKHLKNKSQRSVHFGFNSKHSAKPEDLQDMLDKMFPTGNRLEMFARRQRPGWWCIGNENLMTLNEDIAISLKKLSIINNKQISEIFPKIGASKPSSDDEHKAQKIWETLSY